MKTAWQLSSKLLVFFFQKKKKDAIHASAKTGNCILRFPFTLAKICLHPIKNELMYKMLWLHPLFLLFYIWTPKFFCSVLLTYFIMHYHYVLFTLIRKGICSFCLYFVFLFCFCFFFFWHRKKNIITVCTLFIITSLKIPPNIC